MPQPLQKRVYQANQWADGRIRDKWIWTVCVSRHFYGFVVTRQLTLKTDLIPEYWATSGEYSAVISSTDHYVIASRQDRLLQVSEGFTDRSQVRIEQFLDFSLSMTPVRCSTTVPSLNSNNMGRIRTWYRTERCFGGRSALTTEVMIADAEG